MRPVTISDHLCTLGINDRVELAIARREMNARICAAHMRDGVTIIDPATTYLEPELRIGRDTVIYPNTSISLLSTIGENCVIGPHTRISDSRIGDGVEIRESVVVQSEIGERFKCWALCAHPRPRETWRAAIASATSSRSRIRKICAGREVCAPRLCRRRDHRRRHEHRRRHHHLQLRRRTQESHEIGKNVSIGSNTSIVAPRTIGDDALTGAGSVVTKDVAPGERVAGNPAKPLPKK